MNRYIVISGDLGSDFSDPYAWHVEFEKRYPHTLLKAMYH